MGAVPALPVFLACINRGEFCKALSTSSEVKCGRGATKQNKKQHQNEKKIVNYPFKPYFPLTGLSECKSTNGQLQSAVWREACVLQLKLGRSFIQYYKCIILLTGYWQCACGEDCTALVLQCLLFFTLKTIFTLISLNWGKPAKFPQA